MDRVIWGYGMEQGLNFTLFRPFNWIGAGLDSINTPKEGSSRVVTQFLGHIVRGEPIQLVDGGRQRRSFTYISDGIAALMKIIGNEGGIASGKIYNIGNPANDLSVRELAEHMLKIAATYPEYRDNAQRTRLIDTTANAYYGGGYQDVGHRVPKITNTMQELGWSAQVPMDRVAPHLRRLSRPDHRGARPGGLMSAGAEDRCRYVARHARRHVESGRGVASARTPGHLPVQPGPGSHRMGSEARVSQRFSVQGATHFGGRALRAEDLDVRRAAASAGHRCRGGRRDAAGARRRLRVRHPRLGPCQMA